MSRIGKQPVVIPTGVTLEIKPETLSCKGPKGTLTIRRHKGRRDPPSAKTSHGWAGFSEKM